MNNFDLINVAFTALERRKEFSSAIPRAAATTRHSQDETGKEGSPPADLGTAEVSDSDYDGAPWCSGCRARTAAACKCGPIADND